MSEESGPSEETGATFRGRIRWVFRIDVVDDDDDLLDGWWMTSLLNNMLWYLLSWVVVEEKEFIHFLLQIRVFQVFTLLPQTVNLFSFLCCYLL